MSLERQNIKFHSYSFEKLEVWKNSINFAKLIYKITAKFPSDEKFGIVNQIRRATVSISSNIAEGSGKNSLRDQARFIEIAYGSLLETLNQIILSYELSFIKYNEYCLLREKIESIARQLNALKKSQVKRLKE